MCSICGNSADPSIDCMLGTAEFNRLHCPNDKTYDDVVFTDRFRYQLAIFRNRALIGLSRLLYAHIASEADA